MGWTLGIDSSSTELSIALFGDNRPIAAYSCYTLNAHAEHISHAVSCILSVAPASLDLIDRIGIAVGPGSFTGLRIGIAFVKGWCRERVCRILAVSSLESAAEALGQEEERPRTIVVEARRDNVFHARFTSNRPAGVRRLTPDAYSPAQKVATETGSDDRLFVDTMGYSRSTLPSLFQKHAHVVFAPEAALQRGLACARIAAIAGENDERWHTAESIEPVYLLEPAIRSSSSASSTEKS